MNISNFIEELKRRNVFKVATAYAIAGWLIIQIATSVFPAFDFPQWTTQFVIILVAIGLPISIIIAWAFELTPDGLKKSKEVEITESVTDSTGKKLNGVIIGVLAVTLFFVVIERVFFAKSNILENEDNIVTIDVASIAVLPFIDLSPNGDQEYFSDGLSEELLNVLAKVEDMRVAGRTSSFKFKGLNEDLKIIGEQLGVAHILEGSVRKSGSRIRITAQLIKVSDGYHMWSENYDREYTTDNIFDIQDEISQQVLKELKVRLLNPTLLDTESRPTDNIEAYDTFLQANQLVIQEKIEDIETAIDLYKKAVELDPDFAEAYARLAIAYRYTNTLGNTPVEYAKKMMRENIDKALLLDGNLGRAYDALGRLNLLSNEKESALEAFERAVELLPNDGDVLDGYHLALELNDRYEEGKIVQKKAYDLDPLNPGYATHYANHISSDDPEEAIRVLDNIIQIYPEYADAYSAKSHILIGPPFGEMGQAFEMAYTAYVKDPEDIGMITGLYLMASELNMIEYMGFLGSKIERIAPNNVWSTYSKLDQAIHVENFDELWSILETSDLFDEEDNAYFEAWIQVKAGNYKPYQIYLEKNSPEFLEDEIIIEDFGDAYRWTEYGALLKAMGESNKPEKIKTAVCNYKEDLDKDESENLDYEYAEYFCEYLIDVDSALEYFENIYFVEKDKRHVASNLIYDLDFLLIENNPNYIAFKNKVYTHLKEQETIAIASLKEKGIWIDEQIIKN